MTNSNFDFNTAGEQRDVIPANTVCTLQMTVRPGAAGDDGWLKNAAKGASKGLDCEFTIVDGQYAKRKFWQWMLMEGTTEGHAEMANTNRKTLRAILESALGIRPDDKSEAAVAARKVSSWGDFDQLRFVARLGVSPPRDGYRARNTIEEVITPERQGWVKPEQINVEKANRGAPTAAATPPANAIARPQWAD